MDEFGLDSYAFKKDFKDREPSSFFESKREGADVSTLVSGPIMNMYETVLIPSDRKDRANSMSNCHNPR